MPIVEIVNKVARCAQLVTKILMSEESLAVIALVFRRNRITGKISLVTLYQHGMSHPVVFDVFRQPNLYTEGELHRLFRAERVIKIIHDCKDACAQLLEDHNITTNCVFDTQVAYTFEMELNKLPARLLSYAAMHKNITGAALYLPENVETEQRRDANYWDRRPVSEEMSITLTEEVISLRSLVYPALLRNMRENSLTEFEKRCGYATQGKRYTNDSRPYNYTPSAIKRPVMSINKKQKGLLRNTRALTAEYSGPN